MCQGQISVPNKGKWAHDNVKLLHIDNRKEYTGAKNFLYFCRWEEILGIFCSRTLLFVTTLDR